jgi:hypothetical protein
MSVVLTLKGLCCTIFTIPLPTTLLILHTLVNLSHSLNVALDISFALFVVTDPSSTGDRLQYNFNNNDGILISAIAFTDVAGIATFSWSDNRTWVNQTYEDMDWEGYFYWFLYDSTFQYGYGYREPISPWFQTDLLVTPWISNIFSVELITVFGSNAEIISIQPAEDMFDDVVVCYNCSASPSPQCFPISWPFQVQSYHNPPVNDSYLWFLRLTPSPSGQCLYYFTFSFGIDSISIGVNITVSKNYTLEVTVLGNAYQPRQLVYSTTQPSQGVISPELFNMMWGVYITLFPSNSVSLQFLCLSTHAFTLDFFVHNVNIPLVDQNKPTSYLSVIARSTTSDVNILTFAPSWSLSGLCGWFSSGSLKSLDWILTDVQITLFSFCYNSTDNADTCKSPDRLRLFATGCNSTALMISIASQQIVVTYKVANQPIPVQQLVFPFVYPSILA